MFENHLVWFSSKIMDSSILDEQLIFKTSDENYRASSEVITIIHSLSCVPTEAVSSQFTAVS